MIYLSSAKQNTTDKSGVTGIPFVLTQVNDLFQALNVTKNHVLKLSVQLGILKFYSISE
jgi:hypothetical protein